jgi:hypothetical protein
MTESTLKSVRAVTFYEKELQLNTRNARIAEGYAEAALWVASIGRVSQELVQTVV